ncbi:MAG: Permease of the drug/metabolite transporter (DMT) superfamily [Ktedonobacterales bacterium]|nr:MAG: Permease of the drug/metabolite transporter (DMT) superfamily [Ktedonobacterales bacterium]
MAASTGVTAAKVARGAARTQRRAFLLLILANALWAGTYSAAKIALVYLSPVQLNALRLSLAALLLSPVLLRGWRRIPRDRRTLLALGSAVLLGWILNKLFEYFGLALSTASDVALLISTESLFTAMLSWLLLRERVTRMGIAALALGLAGAYLVVERGLAPHLGGSGAEGARIAGDLLVVLSLLLEAGYTVRGKAALGAVSPLLFTSVTITVSLAFWLPAGAMAVSQSGWPHLPLAGWLAVLYMAGIATALAYWLWFRALAVLDASAAAPTLFVQPLLGAALAVWLVHDTLTWATVAGGALIALSLLLVIRSARAAPAETLGEATP